jgi:hypothetical protein
MKIIPSSLMEAAAEYVVKHKYRRAIFATIVIVGAASIAVAAGVVVLTRNFDYAAPFVGVSAAAFLIYVQLLTSLEQLKRSNRIEAVA